MDVLLIILSMLASETKPVDLPKATLDLPKATLEPSKNKEQKFIIDIEPMPVLIDTFITTHWEEKKKDKRKAMGLSLVLPGLGETYMGHKNKALRAYITEGSIWLAYAGFKVFAGILKDNYLLYASGNAGASMNGQENYYDAVEWYESIEDYNDDVREEARYYYPDDMDGFKKYYEENKMPDSLSWQWESTSAMDKYRNLRKGKRIVLQNASYCIGGAILNRLISTVIILTTKEKFPKYNLEFIPKSAEIRLCLTSKF